MHISTDTISRQISNKSNFVKVTLTTQPYSSSGVREILQNDVFNTTFRNLARGYVIKNVTRRTLSNRYRYLYSSTNPPTVFNLFCFRNCRNTEIFIHLSAHNHSFNMPYYSTKL